MTEQRWWDVLVPVVAAGIATPVFVASPDPWTRGLVALSVAIFVVGYFAVRRPMRDDPTPARSAVFLALVVLSVGIGVAAVPFMAMLQVLAYPFVWTTVRSRAAGVGWTVATGAAVFVGFIIRDGWTVDGLIDGGLSGGLAVIFASALGLWITSIAEYGQERARLVNDLTAAQSQLEALSHERGVAEERERVARDIHDTLAQTLAGLVLLSERAGRQARDERWDAARGTIETVQQTAREALAESRALVARMAAVPADDALAAAIERLAARFRAEAGLAIDVEVAPGAHLDREAQVVLLRCLQEALANVRKHARATLVRVEIMREADTVRMDVEDDGIGFAPDAVRTGFGLDGLQDRVALAGGEVTVRSAPGEGSTLTIVLPAAEAEVVA
ncbi:sensor histidine kinase [Microbacterium sediminicola]|uniref:Oxygen sensor histidine kinase NreB n=1 Tax=Microbacterium sediminicola TaxID=415210 RepID=A0ABP4U6C4_9MICO